MYVCNTVFFAQIYLNDNECCQVLGGDRVGFYNERLEGPIGYQFSETVSVLHGGLTPQLHFVLDFDQLQFPYDFALAAAFDTG